jgi:hypothetical protein
MYMHLAAAAAPAAVAVVPLEPVAQLLLAARVVLVDQEIIKVVAQAQVQALAAAVLHQRILHQSLHHTNHVYQVSVQETQDITQRTVIITALMDHLDANVQIHTNAQLGQHS